MLPAPLLGCSHQHIQFIIALIEQEKPNQPVGSPTASPALLCRTHQYQGIKISVTNCSLVKRLLSYFEITVPYSHVCINPAELLLRLWRALSHSQTHRESISSFTWYRKRGFCLFPDGCISKHNRSGLTYCLCFGFPSFHQHTTGFPQPLWWKPGFNPDNDAGSLPATCCHQPKD